MLLIFITINIPDGYFPIFCAILIYLIENEKRKLYYKIKHNRIIAIGYFVVIWTKSPVGNLWEICPRLLIESKYNFQDRHFATFRKKEIKQLRPRREWAQSKLVGAGASEYHIVFFISKNISPQCQINQETGIP